MNVEVSALEVDEKDAQESYWALRHPLSPPPSTSDHSSGPLPVERDGVAHAIPSSFLPAHPLVFSSVQENTENVGHASGTIGKPSPYVLAEAVAMEEDASGRVHRTPLLPPSLAFTSSAPRPPTFSSSLSSALSSSCEVADDIAAPSYDFAFEGGPSVDHTARQVPPITALPRTPPRTTATLPSRHESESKREAEWWSQNDDLPSPEAVPPAPPAPWPTSSCSLPCASPTVPRATPHPLLVLWCTEMVSSSSVRSLLPPPPSMLATATSPKGATRRFSPFLGTPTRTTPHAYPQARGACGPSNACRSPTKGMAEEPGAEDTPDPCVHPHHVLPLPSSASSCSDADLPQWQEKWETKKRNIHEKCRVVKERLVAEQDRMRIEMAHVQEHEGDIWSTRYRPLKAVLTELAGFSERVRRAKLLYDAVAHEEGTVRIAHSALLLERTTMTLLLRDIKKLAEDSLTLVQEVQQQGPRRHSSSSFSYTAQQRERHRDKEEEEEEPWDNNCAEDVIEEDSHFAKRLLACFPPAS